ncbi:MAG: redox-regulated ATPase YchF [Candidatus Auribacter fodinae]|jgi:GTP-binding protein YchF|uniref:Ribosome-binding ATPase YchF n=1 Tax=Candidatus Auribacter fodinae TaxID=2093366 RepID=A0A3A4QZL1_9BACT|nr:MAG: redox-regulated ATPase YchF [Candidatus Auribacter fodinae]
MSLKCGILGLPNVGKSTIFNALTALKAEASNYPFCTIKPNIGQVVIPDNRLDTIKQYVHTGKVVPAAIEFVDIAGLVRGAHKGEGLGNQFLSHVAEVDALAHVVRSFLCGDVVHVEGEVDPLRDIEIIETEIVLKDIELVHRYRERCSKLAKSGDAHSRKLIEAAEEILEILNNCTQLRFTELHSFQLDVVRELKLLSAKPVIYVLNISENDDDRTMRDKVIECARKTDTPVVAMCGKLEEELIALNVDEQKEFLADLGIEQLGLHSLIHEAFRALKLVTYFTANKNELRAWTIPEGTTAPHAAGKIHTDFERGFIAAEVIAYNDFIAYKGEHGAKEHGHMRLEGKDYIVKDGDIILYRFNV